MVRDVSSPGGREAPAPGRGGRSPDAPEGSAATQSVLRLTVPARPENVALARHILDALAFALALPAARVDDLRLAVTEAVTNVVRHAYEEPDGPLEVVMRPRKEELQVVVTDFGRGTGPSPDAAGPGLGMPLMAALADRLDVEREPGAGTRLELVFILTPSEAPAADGPGATP